jgi:hypothetical protein
MIRNDSRNSSNRSFTRKNYLNEINDFERSEIVNLSGYLIYLTINYNGNVKLYGKSIYI